MEEIHKSNISPQTRGICILLILIGICMVAAVGSYLNRLLHTGMFDFVTILLLSVSAWLVYRWLIVEYRYRIDENMLIIETIAGRKYKAVYNVDLSSVTEVRKAVRPYPFTGRCYVWKDRNNLVEILFRNEKGEKRIVFSPENELRKMLIGLGCKQDGGK